MGKTFVQWVRECNEINVLRKKVFVCENSQNVHALYERCVREKVKLADIAEFSAAALAKNLVETCPDYMDKQIHILSVDEGAKIVNRIICDNKIEYFLNCNDNTCKEIYRNISELRNFEGSLENLHTESRRIKAFSLTVQCYEKLLEDKQLYDDAKLFDTAVSLVENGRMVFDENTSVGIFESVDYNVKQKKFLATIKNAQLICELPQNDGIDDFIEQSRKYDLGIYRCYGSTNEVERIVRDIVLNHKPQDSFCDVSIVCATPACKEIVRDVCGYYGVPLEFADGLPMKKTDMCALLDSLCVWCENGYQFHLLKPVFKNHLFTATQKKTTDKGEIICGKTAIYKNCARNSNGWGIEWYNDREAEVFKGLYSVFCEKETDVSEFYYRLRGFLRKYTKRSRGSRSKQIHNAYAQALSGLINFYKIYPQTMTAPQAMKQLVEVVSSSSYTLSSERSAVICYNVGKTLLLDSKTVYFAGLSADNFPVKANESPILSDDEKIAVYGGNTYLLSGNTEKRQIKSLIDTIMCLDKNTQIQLSYSGFDVCQIRPTNPCALCVMLANDRKIDLDKLDYFDYTFEDDENMLNVRNAYMSVNSLLAEFAKKSDDDDDTSQDPVDPQDIFEDNDQWEDDEDYSDEEEDSEETEEKTEEEKSDENDFNFLMLKRRTDEIEKFRQHNFSFSSTSLNTLLQCRRKYFYEYILKISEERDVKMTSYEWLSSNYRGTFIHNVLEQYVSEILVGKKGSEVSKEADETALDKILTDVKITTLKDYPSYSDELCKKEIGEYKEYLLDYLNGLHKEVSEGAREVVNVETDFKGDVQIGEYTININGRIDRIDKVTKDGETKYQVVDYKTGNRKNFMEQLATDSQDYIYVKAIENGLVKSMSQDLSFAENFLNSDYVFVMEKYDKHIRRKLSENIEKMIIAALKNVSENGFSACVATDKKAEKNCTYCAGKNKFCLDSMKM